MLSLRMPRKGGLQKAGNFESARALPSESSETHFKQLEPNLVLLGLNVALLVSNLVLPAPTLVLPLNLVLPPLNYIFVREKSPWTQPPKPGVQKTKKSCAIYSGQNFSDNFLVIDNLRLSIVDGTPPQFFEPSTLKSENGFLRPAKNKSHAYGTSITMWYSPSMAPRSGIRTSDMDKWPCRIHATPHLAPRCAFKAANIRVGRQPLWCFSAYGPTGVTRVSAFCFFTCGSVLTS